VFVLHLSGGPLGNGAHAGFHPSHQALMAAPTQTGLTHRSNRRTSRRLMTDQGDVAAWPPGRFGAVGEGRQYHPPVISRLKGARLAFQVERVDIPLDALQDRFASDEERRLMAPAVTIPDLGAALQLAPIRALALKELISHARTGKVTINLPVPEMEQSLAVTTLKIEPGHRAILDVGFTDGNIALVEAHGPIEPPIPLPLGLAAKGVYLGRDGSIFVDIPNFPDINLSLVGLFRIPPTVDEVLEQFLGEKEDEAQPSSGAGDLAFDARDIQVEARNVIPRSDPFHLGSAGEISLGDKTRLDVDFAADRLAVRGRVEMNSGELHGARWALRGISGMGTITSSLDGLEQLRGVAVDLQVHDGRFDHLHFSLADGTRLELEDVTVEGAELAYSRRQGKERFRLSARRLAGRLLGGRVVLRIGDEAQPIELGPMRFDGGLTLSEKYFDLDGHLEGARLSTERLVLELGLARLDVAELAASASGRVKVSTDYGYSFTGTLHAEGAVRSGQVALGPIGGGLADGTRASLDITDIHGSGDGLDAFIASGTVDFALTSGAIPLGPSATVSFSRGGRGQLQLHEVELTPGARWPRIQASGHIVAQADPTVVEEIFEIPAGTAHVQAQSATLSEHGKLVLESLRTWLSSDDSSA
jgi:hypothetical protein